MTGSSPVKGSFALGRAENSTILNWKT